MTRDLLFLILFIFLTASCRKDCYTYTDSNTFHVYDTIYPNLYFPAYPGSWWQYSDTSFEEIEPDWFDYITSDELINNGKACPTAKVYHSFAPKMEGFLILKDSLLIGKTKVNHFPSAAEGVIFSKAYGGRSWRSFYEAKDSIVLQAGTYYDIHVYTQHMQAYGSDHDWHDISWDTFYYAKDIGLVKEISRKFNLFAPSESRELVDYFINK